MKTKIKSSESGFSHILLIGLIVLVIGIIASVGMYVFKKNSKNSFENQISATSEVKDEAENIETGQKEKPEEKESNTEKKPQSTSQQSNQSQTQSSAVQNKPKPSPSTGGSMSSTNCLPANASQYDKYYIGKTNLEYIKGNYYSPTNEFEKALDFAGYNGTINKTKYVVFVVNDYTWENKLSDAQENWMYQSQSNMKSVLKWHIVPSCVTYHDDVEGKNTSFSFTTLGGTVQYSGGSLGNVGSAKVAIWDWFTSNGAVHFLTDFVKPPSI